MEKNNYFKKMVLASSLFALTNVSYASGFQLFEYNGAGMGNYQAGGAAIADDASTIFANPAGLSRLTSPELVIAGDGVWSQADFKGTACGGIRCTPVPAHKDGGQFGLVPSAYFAFPVGDRVVLGLGLDGPFGLSTDYGKNNLLSYSASKSEVQTISIIPAISFKFNDQFSVGAGFNAQRLSATLNSEINFFPTSLTPVNTSLTNKADDWAYGFNVGALYQLSERTRFGASFISQVDHTLEGDSKLVGGSIPSLKNNHLRSSIKLPPTAMASFYHGFNDQWSIMGTVAYTKWDTIQAINLRNAAVPTLGFRVVGGRAVPVLGSTTGTISMPENFKNTWRAALGVDYQVNEKWRLRIGGGYDQSPVNNTDRTIRLPDADRWAAAAGVQFKPKENVKLDLGYTHVFIDDGKINHITTVSKAIGKSDNAADLVGLQLTWDFV